MTRAAIALGSNLGDRIGHLVHAVEALARLGAVVSVSNLYETAPVGGPEQDDYLNAVAIIETTLPAERLLLDLHTIEADRGRKRSVRWGPRTLDLDLLLYGTETIDSETCTVPHPRMVERRFVVEPLLDAWPEAALPDGSAVSSLMAAVADQDLTNVGSFWSATSTSGSATSTSGSATSTSGSVVSASNGFGGRGGWWVVVQFMMIGLVVAALRLGGPTLPGGAALRVLGAAAAIAGVVQGALGLVQLGDRLTPFPEPLDGGGIIHGGVYSIVRHPIYGGIVMGLIGLSLVQESLLGLALSVAAGVFFWLKAGREEERLVKRFAHYVEYRAKTRARLVPWVL